MAPQVVCFGEILWDLLPSGEQPGGAPMNVAYHLKKLGVQSAIISRVGADDWGKKLLQLIQGWGLSTEFIQEDDHLTTGIVYAHPDEQHEVTYEIVQPVAWDFIKGEDALISLVQQSGYFVYGSLSARSQTSRTTLFRLLEAANRKVLDINIRLPHFDKALAMRLIQGVDILKLNEHELPVLSGWVGGGNSFETQAAAVQDYFQLPVLLVTRGRHGAVLRVNGTLHQHPGFKVTVADTVGSGDAFLAGFLSQMKEGVSPEKALAFACAAGAMVATRPGACPDYEPAAVQNMV